MTRKRTERLIVTKVTADGVQRAPDELIVEEPMTIQLDGTVVSTTMRTPGNDYELAVGFCHTEGLLGDAPGDGRQVLRHRRRNRHRVQHRHGRDRWTGADADTTPRRHVVELRMVRQRPARRHV